MFIRLQLLVCVVLSALSLACRAQELTLFHTFPEGTALASSLIQAADGNFYSTTSRGTTLDILGLGQAVYQITPGGDSRIFYASRVGSSLSVMGSPIQGGDGGFYLPDPSGGDLGYGILYHLSSSADFTALYSFRGAPDAVNPTTTLTPGDDGDLYGVTSSGGLSNDGTLYKVAPDGTYVLLHSFNGPVDGSDPVHALVQASDGNFYGVTTFGGATGLGTVFQISKSGLFTLLHTFSGPDGGSPFSKLVEGADKSLYGVTTNGGDFTNCTQVGCGTIFKMSFAGDVTTLYKFEDGLDGGYPENELTQASDGNLYSTVNCDVPQCAENIFSVSPSGSLTTVYSSRRSANASLLGGYVDVGLFQDSNGDLLGGSTAEGPGVSGIVYKFTPAVPLSPPVQLTFAKSPIARNTPVTLNWKVLNAASLTMQQCFAFIQGNPAGAGTWTGRQTGIASGNQFSGSATITPTEDGTYTYALTCGGIESGFTTLTVGPTPPVVISTTTLPTGTVGASYTTALTVSGGIAPYTWSLKSGSLPVGLTLSAKTGIISGIPTTAGTSNFVIEVEDSESAAPEMTTASLTLSVVAAAPTVTLQVSPTTILAGQSTALTANVTEVAGQTQPGGTVQFTANGQNMGAPVELANGVAASSAIFFATPGSYSIVAHYGGNVAFSAAVSPAVVLTVTPPAQANPTLSASPQTITIATLGESGSTTLNITGFTNNAISLSCSGLPGNAACSFGPLQGTGVKGTVSMQVRTVAPTSNTKLLSGKNIEPGFAYAGVLPGLFGLMSVTVRRWKQFRSSYACILLAFVSLACGCGVHVNPIHSATYSVTVTASVASQVATTLVTLDENR